VADLRRVKNVAKLAMIAHLRAQLDGEAELAAAAGRRFERAVAELGARSQPWSPRRHPAHRCAA
jgi:hypothetical protein